MSLSNNFPTIAPSLNLDFANTKVLDPRITFTRASTATYYDGITVAMAEQNLLLQSQAFENASWIKSGSGGAVTITANTSAAPDGTTTADTATPNSDTSGYVGQTYSGATSTVYTFSFYIKNISSTQSRLLIRNSSTAVSGFINWTGATLSSITQDVGTTTFTDVGNGWYRVQSTYTSIEATQLPRILPDMSAGTQPVYIWGAQLEQRSAVTAYTATTTQAITNYIPVLKTAAVGVPRFDNNPTTGESLGLLIEEQRVNLTNYSEQFDNAYWTKDNSTITANATVSPDGTLTADLWVPTTSGTTATRRIIRSVSVSSSTAYTVTVYVKSYGRRWVYMAAPDASASSYNSWFDLQNGVVGTKGANVTSTAITAVGNGWYRISATSTSTTVTNYVFISSSDADNSTVVTADGYSGIYIWGAQLEAGAFATSYIPTVASSVTRSADAASMTGNNFSSWYRADQGTMYTDFVFNGLITFPDIFSIGSSSNDFMSISKNSSNLMRCEVVTSGSTVANVTNGSTVAVNTSYKLSMAYAANNIAITLNAATPTTDTDCAIPTANTATIGNRTASTANNLNGTIKKIAYYPLRLTNAQLQALTS